jgi:hypothetical protein
MQAGGMRITKRGSRASMSVPYPPPGYVDPEFPEFAWPHRLDCCGIAHLFARSITGFGGAKGCGPVFEDPADGALYGTKRTDTTRTYVGNVTGDEYGECTIRFTQTGGGVVRPYTDECPTSPDDTSDGGCDGLTLLPLVSPDTAYILNTVVEEFFSGGLNDSTLFGAVALGSFETTEWIEVAQLTRARRPGIVFDFNPFSYLVGGWVAGSPSIATGTATKVELEMRGHLIAGTLHYTEIMTDQLDFSVTSTAKEVVFSAGARNHTIEVPFLANKQVTTEDFWFEPLR